jgi:hypothetical protein
MNELALFSGIGGGILGGQLLGWRTVCSVEIDAFCREVLISGGARMAGADGGFMRKSEKLMQHIAATFVAGNSVLMSPEHWAALFKSDEWLRYNVGWYICRACKHAYKTKCTGCGLATFSLFEPEVKA